MRPVYISAVDFAVAALFDGSNWYLPFNCSKITSIIGNPRSAVKLSSVDWSAAAKRLGPLA